MQLTLYTDYALRTLLYLGVNPDRPVPVAEIAAAYGISAHHVAKVSQALVSGGFVKTRRGRAGGLELALAPERVRVGDVVRRTEPTVELLACFDAASTSCPITGPCRLRRRLRDARDAFLDVLDRTTLADLLGNGPALAARLARPLPVATPRVARRPRRARQAR